MSTAYTNTTKTATSYTNTSKNSTSFGNSSKPIHPWTYNQSGFKYNQVTDTSSIYPIAYNSIGILSSIWSNQSKP